ncbi:MAG TPA: MFS transporter [Stellaceae bacterium]|nr:MFS transporter [Stellaceae bacterium]
MLRSRWVMLALLFWIRVAMGFQFQSVAAVATPLAADLGISAAALGALIGLYIFPGFLTAIPGGALASRLPDRLTATIGLAIMAAGSAVMAVAPSYAALCAGRLVAGVGYALFTLVVTKMVAEWFAGREMLTAMGVMLSSWPCGIALGLAVQPGLAVAYGWPAAQWAVVALCLFDAGLAALAYRAPAQRRETVTALRQWPGRREAALTLLACLAWGGLNVGLIVFFSFAPHLLETRGYATTEAAALVSIGLWVSTASVPLGGMVAERLSRPYLASAMWCAVGAAALLLLTHSGMPALFCVIVGLSIGVPATVTIALPARILAPPSLGIGLGLFYAAYFAQMMLGPMLAGAVADAVGAPEGALWVGSAAFVLGGLVIGFFPRRAVRG